MNPFSWFVSLFRSLIAFIFTCAWCGIARTFKAETQDAACQSALRAGWTQLGKKGAPETSWICPLCK